MHLDELLDHGQADAQPALGAGQRAVALGEQVEDAREQIGPDADAGVADADHGVALVEAGVKLDPAAGLGVLGRVVQQVDDDLLEPGRVGLQLDRRGFDREAKRVPSFVNEGLDDLGRRSDDRGEVDALAPELDLATADPRDVQQVIDQARELADLAIDDLARPVMGLLGAWLRQELCGIGDRRQGVAQLVGQHGQELVLAAAPRPRPAPPPAGAR